VPDNLNANDFRTIRREDGKMQTTYKNWPIYYYSGDQNAGDTNGDGKDGLWVVINPNSFP
jgi:predicted lipoprotein with Yx(FWY)xxD motif